MYHARMRLVGEPYRRIRGNTDYAGGDPLCVLILGICVSMTQKGRSAVQCFIMLSGYSECDDVSVASDGRKLCAAACTAKKLRLLIFGREVDFLHFFS